MTSLKKWQHPTTGEVRVYVNSSRLWPGVKLYFVRQETAGHVFADFQIQGASGVARKQAEEVAAEIGQACGGDWDRLVGMAQ